MKITHTFTIVSSAIILATGCASNQERHSRSSETSSTVDYGDPASYATSTSTSSSANSAQAGTRSDAPGANQTSAPATAPEAATDSDRQLTTQVQQQLNNDPTLAVVAPNIQITAQNGTITLMGSVKSDQEKEKIEAAIRNIGGVVSVRNQLQVSLQPTSGRSGQSSRIYREPSSQSAGLTTEPSSQTSVAAAADAQSSIETQASTQTDPKVQDPTSVSTDAQVSSQTPDSAASQAQDSKDKQVLSPTSDKPNDTSRIYSKDQTDSATQPTADASSANIQASTDADRTLGRQILQDVRADTTVAALIPTIKLKVESGQVTLRGTVKSEQEKQKLESAVQKVSGVTKVDNQLQVRANGQTDTSDASTDSTKNPDTNKNP